MLYKRQQELRYIISKLKRSGRVQLQKLEFLACYDQTVPPYSFVPYNYGPYSFILQKDLDYLTEHDYLSLNEEAYIVQHEISIQIEPNRKKVLDLALMNYGHLNSQQLMKHVYLKHPNYAINSVKAEDLLSSEELLLVRQQKPDESNPRLFTIGYEGKSIDSYMAQLVFNGIKLLIDVRANGNSMKPEFSSKRLEGFCKLLGICYLHYPGLGIASQQRKNVPDKRLLFEEYSSNLEAHGTSCLINIAELSVAYRRIAFTCFESHYLECHRSIVANAIHKRLSQDIGLEHL